MYSSVLIVLWCGQFLCVKGSSEPKSEYSLRCEKSDSQIQNKLRTIIFTAAIGKQTKLSELNEKDYCKYHTFTGALTNIWFQLPICKSVNDAIHDGIADVTGACPSPFVVENMDTDTLTKVMDKIVDHLTADAALSEIYLDARTGIETELSTASIKSCKKDFTAATKVDKFKRFLIHQKFLEQASGHADAKCDPAGYERTVFVLAVIKLAKRPDVRPVVIQMYEDSIADTAEFLTRESKFSTAPADCPIIVEDPNVEVLLKKLRERIEKDPNLMTELELIKTKVTPN